MNLNHKFNQEELKLFASARCVEIYKTFTEDEIYNLPPAISRALMEVRNIGKEFVLLSEKE
jgi:hypothetical protein